MLMHDSSIINQLNTRKEIKKMHREKRAYTVCFTTIIQMVFSINAP